MPRARRPQAKAAQAGGTALWLAALAAALALAIASAAWAQQTDAVPPASTAPTNGLVKPPSVDPAIAAKPPVPPAALKTPVIPPPGTPGGDPTVVPK